MSKFTPGPWHKQYRRDGAVDRVVAGGYDVLLSRGGEGTPVEEWDAMFNLIAEAPALHQELSAFVEAAESWHNFHKHDKGIQCDSLCARITPAKAALAKADGDTQ